jgi:serine/threonine-protein kinase
VLDFGVAKCRDTGNTSPGTVLGTPGYVAPELVRGRPVGPVADVYSLGVLLFRMATGRLPIDAPDLDALLHRCAHETAPAASSIAPVSPGLDALIARCLERDPAHRIPSMDEVRRRLSPVSDSAVALLAEAPSAWLTEEGVATPTELDSFPAPLRDTTTYELTTTARALTAQPYAVDPTPIGEIIQRPVEAPTVRRARGPVSGWAIAALAFGIAVGGGVALDLRALAPRRGTLRGRDTGGRATDDPGGPDAG